MVEVVKFSSLWIALPFADDVFLLASSNSNLQLAFGQFAAKCEVAGAESAVIPSEETPEPTKDMLERLYLLTDLGTVWCPPGGVAGSGKGEEHLDRPFQAVAPATWTPMSDQKKLKQKTSLLLTIRNIACLQHLCDGFTFPVLETHPFVIILMKDICKYNNILISVSDSIEHLILSTNYSSKHLTQSARAHTQQTAVKVGFMVQDNSIQVRWSTFHWLIKTYTVAFAMEAFGA